MFKKCLENRITRIGQDYKCHLCNYVVKQSRFDAVEEHLQTEKHKEKLSKINKQQRKKESDDLREFSEQERKKIVENLVIFDKKPSFWNCCVCKCKISGLSNILQHIRGSIHGEEWVSYIEQNKKIIEQKIKKVSRDKPIMVKPAIDESTNAQVVIPVYQLESNNIIHNKNTNSYYCDICKIKIIATPNISQHSQGSLHQALESKLKKSTSSLKTDFIIYDEKSNSYHCTICKNKIDSTPNVTQHIQTFSHQTLLKILKEKKKESDNESKGFQAQIVFNSQKKPEPNKVDNQNQDKVLEKVDHKFQFTQICYCRPCQIFIRNSLLLKCHVILHLYEESDSLQNLDLIRFKLKPNDKVELKCYLCYTFVCKTDILYADQELEKHLKTDMHLGCLLLFKYNKHELPISSMNAKINSGNITYKPNKNISLELLCNVCDVPVMISNKQQHASGKSHKTKLSAAAISFTNSVNKTEFDSRENLCFYNCFMCDESFSKISNLLQHFETPEHQWKITSLKMINKSSYIKFSNRTKLVVIECSTCKFVMYDINTAINHMVGKRHNEELKLPMSNLINQKTVNTGSLNSVTGELQKLHVATENLANKALANNADNTKNQRVSVIKLGSLQKIKKVNKFEASEEELNQLGFSTESIQIPKLNLDETNSALDNLISLDFEDSQVKRLPRLAKTKFPRAPKLEGQRNSFATNVLLNGKQYIKLCINSGLENIYNFDSDKMTILKLGVSLTFPYQSNRACIPCGQQFPVDLQSLFEHLQKQEHLDNINEMQAEDTKFYLEDCSEQFSDLRLAKLYMHVLDQGIQCNACNVQVNDDDEIIRQHVQQLTHKEKSKLWQEQSEQLFNQYFTIYKDIWYYAEVFFCEICKKKCEFEMDFVKHLIHPEHTKKVYEHKFKRVDLTYDLCPSCITYWFGTTNSYEMHCKSNFHKRFVKNKDFMVPNLTVTASEFLDNIDENANLLENESNKIKVEEESDKETALLNTILETVKPAYPNAEAYIFGSRLSHLGSPSSDVDIFLDCENVYYLSSTQEQSQQCITSVKSYFESTSNSWVVDEILLTSRIPIMKLRYIPTNLKCDISFTNGLSVEKSKLVGIYNIAFPLCRKLILFMKKWLTLCRLFGSDCITTFAMSWCVIFYLQLQGILPTVYELIERKKQSKIVDGWECGFEELFTAEISDLSFKEHLKGFFTYFANFDYQASVICPYLGKTIHKHDFAYSDELPIEMDIYKNRLKNNEIEIFRFDSPLCIQDPIDLSQNMTKAVTKKQLRCFRQYCILSADKC